MTRFFSLLRFRRLRLAGGRACLLVVTALLAAILGTGLAQAEPLPRALLILDGSRSMWGKLDGVSKVKMVRDAVDTVLPRFHGRVRLGLLAFGFRQKDACDDVRPIVRLRPLRAKRFAKVVRQIGAKGESPLSATLIEAEKMAASRKQETHFILIADGSESCLGDPCANATRLKRIAPKTRVHVLALNVTRKKAKADLACIANKTGGRFVAITKQGQLAEALHSIFASFATPISPAGAQAAAPAPAPQTAEKAPETPKKPTTIVPPPPLQTSGAKPTPAPAETLEAAQAPTPATAPVASPQPATPTSLPPKTKTAAAPQPKDVKADALVADVTFAARLSQGRPLITSGLVWRIYPISAGLNSSGFKPLYTLRESQPTVRLPLGTYLVNAALGLAQLTRKVVVAEDGKPLKETFILNAGGLRLDAALPDGTAIPPNRVTFHVYSDERNQAGERKLVLANAPQGRIIILNAGIYHIVSRYGDANAVVKADVAVEAGKLADVTANHAAATVTFKLVNQPGGEALADTSWRVLTPTGQMVKASNGALPTHILAAGRYTVLASHNGRNFSREFRLTPGEVREIELVIQ